ncbi:hypothetical protein H5410_014245 [Solanum commersonii]|uniref:Uncharacterized protein n=1 Tax=Solanum commersonii TaxID=4109 RepID=A0A9J5ZQD7_SOLCO|nr:hypothetical protein H5410_014245 [Solanum commersonii]
MILEETLFLRTSLSGDKVCGVGPGVVVNWVSEVVRKVFQWTLSGDDSLNKESKHGEHSKSTILDFLHLKLSKSLWWVNNLTERSTSNTVTLYSSHQHNLTSPNGQDALCMDQAWVAQVIKSTLTENLGSSFEPYNFIELRYHYEPRARGRHNQELQAWPIYKNGPKYLTRSGPYHGLPEETGLALVTVFLIMTFPFLVISEEDGESFTTFPAKEGEDRAIVEAAIE